MITEKQYQEAKQIIDLYNLEQHKKALNAMLPKLYEGEFFEYKDLGGGWYKYDLMLQENPYFIPDKIRVNKNNQSL